MLFSMNTEASADLHRSRSRSSIGWRAWEGRGQLRGLGGCAEFAQEPRPHRGPAPFRRALAALPAASGGRPGRCDPAALGAAAAVVATGTSRCFCTRVLGAVRRFLSAPWPVNKTAGAAGR